MSLQRLPFRDFTAEEFLGRTLTTRRGAGSCVSVFQEAVSLSARWLMRAFMLAGAPTSIRKASGSIPVRNVKIEPAEKVRSLNSWADLAVSPYQ